MQCTTDYIFTLKHRWYDSDSEWRHLADRKRLRAQSCGIDADVCDISRIYDCCNVVRSSPFCPVSCATQVFYEWLRVNASFQFNLWLRVTWSESYSCIVFCSLLPNKRTSITNKREFRAACRNSVNWRNRHRLSSQFWTYSTGYGLRSRAVVAVTDEARRWLRAWLRRPQSETLHGENSVKDDERENTLADLTTWPPRFWKKNIFTVVTFVTSRICVEPRTSALTMTLPTALAWAAMGHYRSIPGTWRRQL